MGIFGSDFALSFIAVTLLVSSVGHLAAPAEFQRVIRSHGVFPSWLAGWIGVAVSLFELSLGTLAAVSLRPSASFGARVTVLVAAAAAGCAFWIYLRRLLSSSGAVSECGCSPLSAPLTKASLAPSVALIVVSAVGFIATVAVGLDDHVVGLDRVLPCLWGVTLSGITLLYPAAVLHFRLRSDS
jgi:methylamine utilization protein MauE